LAWPEEKAVCPEWDPQTGAEQEVNPQGAGKIL
jgi:hypothetical protein